MHSNAYSWANNATVIFVEYDAIPQLRLATLTDALSHSVNPSTQGFRTLPIMSQR